MLTLPCSRQLVARSPPLRPADLAPPTFVALRTPLLPLAFLEEWAAELHCASTPDDREAWLRDCRLARARMRAVLDDPAVLEALFLASPSLLEGLAVWCAEYDEDADAPVSPTSAGIEASLTKYLTRMATRCTPFGLFAGTSVGAVGRENRAVLRGREAGRRTTRLDMEVLDQIVQHLTADPAIRRDLRFTANSSLYEAGGALRYAEARTVDGRRSHFLVDVEPHDPLRRGLERARTAEGAKPEEIALAIAGDEVDLEVAREFTEQLIAAQLLVPTLGPVVTGSAALDHLIERLEGIESASAARAVLTRLRDGFARMDRHGPGVEPRLYLDLAEQARALVPISLRSFVQVDLLKPAEELTVTHGLVEELARAVHLLVDLFSYGWDDPLAEFKQAFEQRYGERTVPLVEVLDEEIGIGFGGSQSPGSDPSPLVAGLPFAPPRERERVFWGSRGRHLLWRVCEAIAEGAEELVLDPREFAQFHEDGVPELPDAFHVQATLLSSDPRTVDAPLAILDHAGGPSGARLLGRFCHGDSKLQEFVQEHLRAEEALDPGVRYFEVVHLPEGRTGNILARPVLRDLELEFLGTSGAPPERVLRVDDLTITVSRGRVLLRSRRLDCEVRPRITTAHNTRYRSLPMYRFLSALQGEGRLEGVFWTWGPLESQPRLPRVRMGRLVLARAQWSLARGELAEFRTSGHEGFRRVQAWRARRLVPRWIGLVEQENALAVDLDHPLSVASFLDALRGREEAIVHELHPGARPDVVEAPEGRFANELLVPFVRRIDTVVARREAFGADAPDRGEGVFAPGSPWLSAKLYCGPTLADPLLTGVIAPLARTSIERGSVDRWFFLRYADPDPHLRVRWHGDPGRLTGELIPALHAACADWFADGRLHRLEFDTYQRETRRYGGPEAIEAAEEIFCHDCTLVSAFLEAADDDAGLDSRWRMSLVAMDRLLCDAGLDLEARHDLMDRLARMYADEFRLEGPLRASLRDRFRGHRHALEESLAGEGAGAALLGPGYELLSERSRASREAFARLRDLDAAGKLTVPLAEICASFLHMHANRMLRSAARAQEMVLYRFLEKCYASRLARHRRTRS